MPEKKASKPKPAQKRRKKHPHEASTPSASPMKDPPRREPGKRATTRAGREKLPTCGAENRQGNPCKKPAGAGTSHPGEGRCRLHGGVGQLPRTRYSDLQVRPRLQELINRYTADPDAADLNQEVGMLRALIVDYVERYDDITAAVLGWHASYGRGFDQAVQKWRGDLADWVEAQDRGDDTEPPRPPIPEEFERKPRQVLDITAAGGLIGQLGALSDRIERRQREGTISMATMATVLDELAYELVNACEEVGIRDADRTRLLTVVDRRWRDARSIPRDALLAAVSVPERTGPPN